SQLVRPHLGTKPTLRYRNLLPPMTPVGPTGPGRASVSRQLAVTPLEAATRLPRAQMRATLDHRYYGRPSMLAPPATDSQSPRTQMPAIRDHRCCERPPMPALPAAA